MSKSDNRAEWTRDAIERTKPDPYADELGYESIVLSISSHIDSEHEYTVFQDPDNPQSYIRMETQYVYDIELAACNEATNVRREYE